MVGEYGITVIEGKEYFTVNETAERVHITSKALRQYMSLGKIKFTKIEAHSYFSEEQIEAFLKPRRKRASAPKPKKDWREELENMVDRVYRKYSKGVRA